MNYSAEIKIFGDADLIFKCFQSETSKGDRSNFSIKKRKNHVVFLVEAKDSVALRATTNSIIKLFSVYEKINNLTEE